MLLRNVAIAGERGTFCLAGGVEQSASPFLYVADEERGIRQRARLLMALVDPVERAPGDEAAGRVVIDELRDALDGRDPDEVIETLHEAFTRLSQWLLQANRASGGRRKVFLGLTCIVGCQDDLFVAQVPPGQALIRQDGRLFAFPKLRSWLPMFQPSRTYDLPNPLGLRDQTEPQVYYSRLAPGDLLVLTSSSVAARLEPLQDEIRDAAGVADVVDTVADLCDRHGLVSGSTGVILV